MNANQETLGTWGLLAQFASSKELLQGMQRMRETGCTSLEAFTPFPLPEAYELLRSRRSPMPPIILAGGIVGGVVVYALQYWINLVAYPLNIGGRPLHSWPAFIPATFEGVVLVACLFGVIGVIIVCGLPRLHHPVFEINAFKRASTNGFFLAVKANAANFNALNIASQLKQFGASEVWEVPNA